MFRCDHLRVSDRVWKPIALPPNHDSPDAGRRIGALATASGLSVRALRHYDEIDLLAPSGRSEAEHRLYSISDVERLYRIRLPHCRDRGH